MSKLNQALVTVFASVLTLAAAAPAFAADTGSIKGTVKVKGAVPKAEELNMKSDPFCAQHTAKDESVVADGKGGLKNVVVRLAKGVTGTSPAATGDVVLDQNGCTYVPRVAVAVAGQQILIKNSDQTLHNVHTYKGPATLFNQAQPQGFPPLKKKFAKSGDIVKFKCDVHPWMTGWVVVVDNPYYAVSSADGSFTINNVPAGKYTVEYWHEKLGTQTVDVEVKAGKPAALNLEMAAK
ncbi:MAG: carboxypeptidase regulatory-like domain-containing protein [Deltaproteobacteria bacterium]|nr:carboxypeptidase regulatory-like domain-containing protein [Deltaproteobacteria bacterium]